MSRMRMGLVGLAVATVLIGGGAWLARGKIEMALMDKAFDTAIGANPFKTLPDGLNVGLCGAGSPMPDPTRAGPCAVVVAGRRIFVVDAGEGSVKNLSLMNLPPAAVNAVFLTHFHSDHIADLGELMLQRWAGGAASTPLPVYGPTGIDQVVAGFEQAYALDRGYRIAHHGPKVVPPAGFGGLPHAFSVTQSTPEVQLMKEPDLQVYAFLARHEPVQPAVGYVFVYKGRRVVISGDTAISSTVEAAAKDADVLVHEGLAPNLVELQRLAAMKHGRTNLASIFHDILSYHTAPAQAAGLAARAHVRMLLFTHVIPPLPTDFLDDAYLGDAPKLFKGQIRVGHDGDFISLPSNTGDIRQTNRLKRSLLAFLQSP